MATRTLAEEIKQTRPFRSRAQEATMALLRTSNQLRRRLDAIVAAEEITSQQYNVLRILRGAKAPLPTMEIAERMIDQAPGITRHVNNLEERGLIRREPWAGDKRQVLCQITPAGLRVLERLDGPIDAFDDALASQLTPEQIDHLIEALDLLRSTSDA